MVPEQLPPRKIAPRLGLGLGLGSGGGQFSPGAIVLEPFNIYVVLYVFKFITTIYLFKNFSHSLFLFPIKQHLFEQNSLR